MNIPTTALYPLVVAAALALAACQPAEGPLERAGKAVDNAAAQAGNAVDNAADKAKDAVDDLKKK